MVVGAGRRGKVQARQDASLGSSRGGGQYKKAASGRWVLMSLVH